MALYGELYEDEEPLVSGLKSPHQGRTSQHAKSEEVLLPEGSNRPSTRIKIGRSADASH